MSCTYNDVDITPTEGKHTHASSKLQHTYFTDEDAEQKLTSTVASRPKEADDEKYLYSANIVSKIEACVDDARLDESEYMVPDEPPASTVINVQPSCGVGESILMIEGAIGVEPLYTEPDEEQYNNPDFRKGNVLTYTTTTFFWKKL